MLCLQSEVNVAEQCFHEPNCESTDTLKCTVGYHDDNGQWAEDVFWYCHDHAADNGFCYCCGLFCAGIESFSFGRLPGLCDNCRDEIEANEARDAETEMDYYPYPY